MGRHTERAAAMRRHPAGKARHMSHTSATVIPFTRGTILATATAETTNEKGTSND